MVQDINLNFEINQSKRKLVIDVTTNNNSEVIGSKELDLDTLNKLINYLTSSKQVFEYIKTLEKIVEYSKEQLVDYVYYNNSENIYSFTLDTLFINDELLQYFLEHIKDENIINKVINTDLIFTCNNKDVLIEYLFINLLPIVKLYLENKANNVNIVK